MEQPQLTAETVVNVPHQRAVEWFMSLKEHPERYRFATHDGFVFTEGDFGTPGAHFETRERFFGLRINLRFELTDIQPQRFHFRLRRLPVWGAFELASSAGTDARQRTLVRLHVGGSTAAGRTIVRCPIVRHAIERQIRGEVGNIKLSMERLYNAPGEEKRQTQ